MSEIMAIWSADGSGPAAAEAAPLGGGIGASISNHVSKEEDAADVTEPKSKDSPGSSMCSKSQFIAVSASLFPVANKAFWHRMVGKPIDSSCDNATALNSGPELLARTRHQ